MSHNTLRKAEKIKEAKKTDPEIKELWNRFKNMEISLEYVFRVAQQKNEEVNNQKQNSKTKNKKSVRNCTEIQKNANEIIAKANITMENSQFIALNKTNNSLMACCFNCKNVKIKTCIKCPKMCFIFTCEEGHEITFHCDEFEF